MCLTSAHPWHVAVLCQFCGTDGALGLPVPEGRFGLGFGLHCSSSRSRTLQSIAAWPVFPQWEDTSFCALTLLIPCPAFSLPKYSAYLSNCQLANTHARACDVLVVDVLDDHALDLRVLALE